MDSSEAYSPHAYSDEVLATLLANAKEPSGVELNPENQQLAVGDSALVCPSPLVGGEAKESWNGEVDEGFEGEVATHLTWNITVVKNWAIRHLRAHFTNQCYNSHVYRRLL